MTDKSKETSSLHWVRDEIEKNTDDAIAALENYFEYNDNSYISQAQKSLHEIYGTLQIVELYPPSTLANEIEKTLAYILESDKTLDSNAISEIIQSINLIVRYIDSALREIPFLNPENLITPLNILRSIRQEKTIEPLQSTPLYSFNNQKLGSDNPETNSSVSALSLKLLKLFQFSYLKFAKNEEQSSNIAYMAQSVKRFSKLYPQANLIPLWNALCATIDSLIIDDQYTNTQSINEYLGKITHLLKIFSSPKATQITSKSLTNIFNQTLDILKKLPKKTPLGEQLLNQQNIGNNDYIEKYNTPKNHSKLITKSTLIALSTALLEEIGYVKDALDVFSRSNKLNKTELPIFLEKLKQLSDSMLLIEDLELPRQALDQQILIIDQIITTSQLPDNSWLVELATALLFVEFSAERIIKSGSEIISELNNVSDIINSATQAVIHEIIIDISKVKSLFVDAVSSSWNTENLQQMLFFLKQIAAQFLYINEQNAINIVKEIIGYITYDLLNRKEAPAWVDIEKFADIIAALDQYLYLKSSNKNLPYQLLDDAKVKLKTLYNFTSEQKEKSVDDTLNTNTIDKPLSIIYSHDNIVPSPPISAQSIHNINNDDDDDDDDIIREIFLEELDEIIENVESHLIALNSNISDTKSLTEIRRLVHTLKGSGQVANVLLISDVAFHLEKRLNELLENNHSPTPSLLKLISEFINKASKMANEVTQETKADSLYFIKCFSDNNYHKTVQNDTNDKQNKENSKHEEKNEINVTDSKIDTNSLFSNLQKQEIQSHFNVLFNYYQSNKDYIHQSHQDINISRAAHTLKAIFNSNTHLLLSEVFTHFEKLLRSSFKSNQHNSHEFFNALEICCKVIDNALNNISELDITIPKFMIALSKLEDLLHKSGANDNPYENWLEENHAVFDILLQNNLIQINNSKKEEQSNILKISAKNAGNLKLCELENILLIFSNSLYLSKTVPVEKHDVIAKILVKMQQALLNIADQIAMGQIRIELDRTKNLFNELHNKLQEECEKLFSTQETISSENINSALKNIEINNTNQDFKLINEDSNEEIRNIFKQELSVILDSIDNQLQFFIQNKGSATRLQELQRDYHTIKGGADYIQATFLKSLAKEADLICERFLDANQLLPLSVISILLLTQNLFRHRLEKLPNMLDLNEQEIQVINDLRNTRPTRKTIFAEDKTSQELLQESSDALSNNSKSDDSSRIHNSNNTSKSNTIDHTDTTKIPFNITEDNKDIIEIFVDEVYELLEDLAIINHQLTLTPEDTQLDDIKTNVLRLVHTVKGGARLTGLEVIGSMAHKLEENIEHSKEFNPDEFLPKLEYFYTSVLTSIKSLQSLLPQNNAPIHHSEITTDISLDKQHSNFNNTNHDQTLTVSLENSTASNTNDNTIINNPMALSPTAKTDTESLSEYDPEILEIFYEESHELVEELETIISQIENNQVTEKTMDQLKRVLHTLKGSARLAGFPKFGNQAHIFESRLENITTPTKPAETQEIIALNDSLFTSLQETLKAIKAELQHKQKPTPTPTPIDILNREKPTSSNNTIQIQPRTKTKVAKRNKNTEVVRVGAELLEKLLNLAGETMIAGSSVHQELLGFSRIIDDFGLTLDRIRDQIRNFENETESRMLSNNNSTPLEIIQNKPALYGEFDTLEMDRFSAFHQLARSLSESASDLIDMKDSMLDKVRVTETLVMQQTRVETQLHEGLMQSRMVPFSRLAPRLTRMVRQVADELGKKAELSLINAEGEMDRSVLERMIPPLEHMLRNALDHGIEVPEIRIQQGKNPVGKIILHIFREGNEIVLRLSDDGAGIDVQKVKNKAIAQGLLTDDTQLTEKEILQFIFKPGFSTATEVTQISGRGVGMDVVFSEIKQLNGSLKLHAAPNVGTQFTIRLPFTVSMSRALMVMIGEDEYAIPLTHLEGVVRISSYELDAIYESKESTFSYANKKYEVKYLGQYLSGNNRNSKKNESVPLILARNTERSIAMQVDRLIGSKDIVVKNTGAQLSQVAGLSGASILPDGSVVIILDLNSLIRDTLATGDNEEVKIKAPTALASDTPINPLILVVDDSVTVRKVTSRLLERHGIDVVTAKDGIDAINQLRDLTPSLILLDIEMPRMDGFEVASHIRHDPRLAKIPIIMISSRTGEKHRSRAAALGVNEFLGKPFQELKLIEHINELVIQK